MKTANMYRDYSADTDKATPSVFHNVNKQLWKQDTDEYNKVKNNFLIDNWFALRMTPFIKYLDFSIEGKEATTMSSLIYAYSHSGTANAIVSLCKGLFGLESTIIFTPSAGVVNLEVSNVNINFLKGFVSAFTGGKGIVVPPEGILFDDFSELAGNALDTLILQFLPTGWKLEFTILPTLSNNLNIKKNKKTKGKTNAKR